MTRTFRLILDVATSSGDQEAFYWTTSPTTSTVVSSVGPSLGKLGGVPALNIDLVRVAVGVYLADRSFPRRSGGSDWNQREISVTVPVSDADTWDRNKSSLSAMLAFLSGDSWAFDFVQAASPAESVALPTAPIQRVVLLSGGADSAVGALRSRLEMAEGNRHLLVSHFSANHLAGIQRSLAQQLDALAPRMCQSHEIIHFARKSTRADGSKYDMEPSSRSRSFLFLSLGLAAAAVSGVDLWIPENGFASINPPLAPDRRGSLSTRTTHPAFLKSLSEFGRLLGIRGSIHNPFAKLTKGEMFAWTASQIGDAEASRFLSSTNSCSTTGQRSFRVPVRVHCGVCFGCVLRRSAFDAASIADLTEYADPAGNPRLSSWLDRNSVVPAVRGFVERGVGARDLIALSLPSEFMLAEALDLTRRGSLELAGYVS